MPATGPVVVGVACDDIAPVGQPLQRLFDLVGRKFLRELAHQRGAAFAVLADGSGDRAIERAVKEEFPVLGVKTDAVGRQDDRR